MSQAITTPVLDDVTHRKGANRGAVFVEMLRRDLGIDVHGKTILDLGGGYGSVAIAAAEAGARVLLADIGRDQLKTANMRWREKNRGDCYFHPIACDLFQLPIADASADLAFLIGVVEYAGLWNREQPVWASQRALFASAYRALKPGGVLLFASKNRWWPTFALNDPHVGLPAVAWLPRRLANALCRCAHGTGYRHHIHGWRGWNRLLHASGFLQTEAYVPVFRYQFPIALLRSPTWRRVSDATAQAAAEINQAYLRASSPAQRSRVTARKVLLAFGNLVHAPLSQDVLFVARKKA